MATATTYVIQTFEMKRKRLVPGARDVAPTESGALKRAEAIAARKPGAAALRIRADSETGELEGVAILGRFGEVPDDFAEMITGS
ncbi:conserved hypothetical protein [Methylobacterium sp. 4-46]|uniref:hypothetical protein n=1 Tax=unclassified Methylobacterium TaxID=2615210 RepID=UPI000152E51E|nr:MULTISPECIES: hypothetical protein [Methylobacterium]ACA17397.1 conserved hypothetical protein [Methylobacterium sp. 4-46]WFT83083.1 hypothetical protein QA634_15150 [Methylobacterium nodulans]